MNFIQEHEARLEKARRQMSEDSRAASEDTAPDQGETQVVAAVASGSASGCTAAAIYWARKRTLENAIEALATGLPDGWTVRLGVECGAAFVHIESPDGKETLIEDDGDLYDHLRLAHRFATEHEPNT